MQALSRLVGPIPPRLRPWPANLSQNRQTRRFFLSRLILSRHLPRKATDWAAWPGHFRHPHSGQYIRAPMHDRASIVLSFVPTLPLRPSTFWQSEVQETKPKSSWRVRCRVNSGDDNNATIIAMNTTIQIFLAAEYSSSNHPTAFTPTVAPPPPCIQSQLCSRMNCLVHQQSSVNETQNQRTDTHHGWLRATRCANYLPQGKMKTKESHFPLLLIFRCF